MAPVRVARWSTGVRTLAQRGSPRQDASTVKLRRAYTLETDVEAPSTPVQHTAAYPSSTPRTSVMAIRRHCFPQVLLHPCGILPQSGYRPPIIHHLYALCPNDCRRVYARSLRSRNHMSFPRSRLDFP